MSVYAHGMRWAAYGVGIAVAVWLLATAITEIMTWLILH